MVPNRIIIGIILSFLLLISFVGLYFVEVETHEAIDTVQPDPYEITGDWYVVALFTPRNDLTRFRCWTVNIKKISSNSYIGISYFTDTMSVKRRLVNFMATISDKTEQLVVFDVSMMLVRPTIDFQIHHMIGRRNTLVLSMDHDDESKLFDFLILSTEPTLTEKDPEIFRADIYINNTKC